jgi:hypothetical protein
MIAVHCARWRSQLSDLSVAVEKTWAKIAFMTTSERERRIRARLASLPEMTAEERARQRESFAYGNVKIDEPTVTRDLNPTRR